MRPTGKDPKHPAVPRVATIARTITNPAVDQVLRRVRRREEDGVVGEEEEDHSTSETTTDVEGSQAGATSSTHATAATTPSLPIATVHRSPTIHGTVGMIRATEAAIVMVEGTLQGTLQGTIEGTRTVGVIHATLDHASTTDATLRSTGTTHVTLGCASFTGGWTSAMAD